MDTAIDNAETAMQTLKSAAETGYARASAGLEQGQAQIKDQMGRAMKKAEEVAAFNQGTIEAMMKCGQIWTAGLQSLSRQLAATTQTQFEETVSSFKTLGSVRSLKDLMDLQADFARAAVDKAMSETGRLTDAGLKLAEESMAPLTARMSVAMETFSKAA